MKINPPIQCRLEIVGWIAVDLLPFTRVRDIQFH